MSTPVIHTRRHISELNEERERYAVVRGQRIARTSGFDAPRVIKPEWDKDDPGNGSNTRLAGVALDRPRASRWSERIGHGSTHRTAGGELNLSQRVRRRVLEVVSSPGGIIVSASAILLSIGLAPVVAEEPVQYTGPAPVSVVQQK